MKILVANDSEFMRKILKDIIQTAWADAELLEAASGDEAISQLQTSQPDIALLDIMMPGKTGLEVMKEVGSDVPIVIVSAAGQDNLIEEAKHLGAKGFVVKPFEKAAVIQNITSALGQGATTHE